MTRSRRPVSSSIRPSAQPVLLRDIDLSEDTPSAGYPFEIPSVQHLNGLKFAPVTCFVGDNGSGKSTIVEALAVAAGFNPEGGSRNLLFNTHASHSELHRHLRLHWYQQAKWGWFLRAETFYNMATHITNDGPFGVSAMFPDFHLESHGESFLELARIRFARRGLYIFDEPEAALSIQGQMQLMRLMHESCLKGAQFIVATHSPILMAYPEAEIYECSEDGLRSLPYDEVPAVQLWRRFLGDPQSILRHLMSDE